MKKKNLTTRIVLDLKDDEFMALGAMAFSVDTWNPDVAKKDPFGRVLLQLKEKMEAKATPGQRDYLEKVIFALQEAVRNNPDNTADLKDDFKELMADTEDVLEVLDK